MKYFIDTEFLEGTQDKRFLGIKYGETKPTIDLISIGIVCEDGREYYAISKDFNLKEAWNRYDLLEANTNKNHSLYDRKIYWIRENVLKPIWEELRNKQNAKRIDFDGNSKDNYFSYNSLKYLIKKYGKTNKQIAEEIIGFVTPTNEPQFCIDLNGKKDITYQATKRGGTLPQFYGYYSDYDWVVFCWLFGKMNDLPKGFPQYCKDLKQMLDEKIDGIIKKSKTNFGEAILDKWKLQENFPKQTNEHNAIADARWNKKLYEFLQTI